MRQYFLPEIASRVQRMEVEPIAEFASQLAHTAIDASDENRNARIFVRRRAEERRHQSQLIKLAPVVKPGLMPPAIPHCAHGKNVLAHLGHLPFPLYAKA